MAPRWPQTSRPPPTGDPLEVLCAVRFVAIHPGSWPTATYPPHVSQPRAIQAWLFILYEKPRNTSSLFQRGFFIQEPRPRNYIPGLFSFQPPALPLSVSKQEECPGRRGGSVPTTVMHRRRSVNASRPRSTRPILSPVRFVEQLRRSSSLLTPHPCCRVWHYRGDFQALT